MYNKKSRCSRVKSNGLVIQEKTSVGTAGIRMHYPAPTDRGAVVPFARTTQHEALVGRFSDLCPTLRPLPVQYSGQ